ncbi:Uncharacterized protein QTN25_006997 [Entamoeba marina]
MRSTFLSAFEPAPTTSFAIYDGKVLRKTASKKKRWSQAVKMKAVRKFHELGLTKAVRYLTKINPEQFKDLTPSTLQYWVHILSPDLFKKVCN